MKNIYDYFDSNDLIKSLPPVRDKITYFNSFEKSPYTNEEMKTLSPLERSLLVSGLREFRVSRDVGFLVDYQIAAALRKGYMISIKCQGKEGGTGYNEKSIYKKKEEDTSAFILYGPSGVGKTTLLNESLSYYNQVITHSGPDFMFIQVVYIKVECPPAGSVKTFFDSCLDELEKALDCEIHDRSRYRTADQKEQLFKHLAGRWNLGLLVIDEIQNLFSNKNGVLMNQFLKLNNELGVPIIYVGTDKIVEYMENADFFTIRRLGIQIPVEPYKQDILWDRMLEEMWKNQWMQEFVPLTKELNDVFYQESKGIISRVVDLFAFAQREAILNGQDTIKCFTPEYIKYVSNSYFRMKGNLNKPPSLFKSEQGELLKEEMKSAKHVILDSKRNKNKQEKDSLRNRIITNVLKSTEMMPFSFSQTEINNVIKEVSKRKDVLSKDETELTKLVISELMTKHGFVGSEENSNKSGKNKKTISEDEFPKFDGVI